MQLVVLCMAGPRPEEGKVGLVQPYDCLCYGHILYVAFSGIAWLFLLCIYVCIRE